MFNCFRVSDFFRLSSEGYLSDLAGLDRQVKLLLVIVFLMGFPVAFWSVIYSVYLSQLGIAASEIGMMYSVFILAGAATFIPFGLISDRYGRKIMVFLATVFQAFSASIFLLSTSLPLFYVAFALTGLAMSAMGPFDALLTEKCTESNRNLAFSLSSLTEVLGVVFGSLLVALPDILREFSPNLELSSYYKPLFGIQLAAVSGALVIVLLLIKEKEFQRGGSILPRASFAVVAKYSVIGIAGTASGIVTELFPLWLTIKFAVTGSELGPFYAALNLAVGLGFVYSPILARKLGDVKMIFSTQLLSIMLLATVPIIPSFAGVEIVYALRSVIYSMSFPVLSSFLMGVVPERERASARGIASTAGSILRSPGPALAGYLIGVNDLALPFYAASVLYLFPVSIFYAFFRGPKVKKHEDTG